MLVRCFHRRIAKGGTHRARRYNFRIKEPGELLVAQLPVHLDEVRVDLLRAGTKLRAQILPLRIIIV